MPFGVARAEAPSGGTRVEGVSSTGGSAHGFAQSAAAIAVAIEPEPQAAVATAVANQAEPEPAGVLAGETSMESLREGVLTALENAGQQVLAHNLEQGEWSMRGMEISVKVAMSQAMVDFALGEGPKKVINKALGESGKPWKFKMVSGGAQFTAAAAAPRQSNGNGGSARSRAMADPVVKQMQETFGAEVRTVIDLKQRS
jgi:DNA polymerase-3 subunit gamma/tau